MGYYMGWNDHLESLCGRKFEVTCRCGAKYSVYVEDEEPGCRDLEVECCEFCGEEIARHFGTCIATLIDDKDASDYFKA